MSHQFWLVHSLVIRASHRTYVYNDFTCVRLKLKIEKCYRRRVGDAEHEICLHWRHKHDIKFIKPKKLEITKEGLYLE